MAADIQAIIGIVPEIKMLESENLTVTGIEEVDGKKAYAVEMKGQSTTTTTYYAVESGLKLNKQQLLKLWVKPKHKKQLMGSIKVLEV